MEKNNFLNIWRNVTGKEPKGNGEQYKGLCPAHDDHKESLSVRFKPDGQILVWCHAGCSESAVADALGISVKDLFPDSPATPVTLQKETVYRYTDKNGTLLAEKVRYPDKSFSWRRPDGHGGYVNGTNGLEIPLYNIQCLNNDTGYVFLVEGEKDVDTLKTYVPVVCNPNGANEWKERYNDMLAGQDVYIIPDNDKPGRDHAIKVYRSLKNKAKAVYLIDLRKLWPEIPEKGDISDYFAHDKEGLVKLNEYQTNAPLFVESLLDGIEVVTVEGKSAPANGFDFDLKTADAIEEKEAEFLIYPYIPRYQTTIIAAPGGIGKTTTVCNIAAAISSGNKSLLEEGFDFYEKREPGTVLFLTAEDVFKYTLKRRLRLQGANPKNILCLDAEDKRLADAKLKSEFLEGLLKRYKPVLCILDPIQAFLPTKVEMSSRNEMRDCLEAPIYYGAQYGVTTLIVAHTNKQSNVWGRKRLADSSDIWDASRSVLMMDRTGDGETRYISQEKANLSPPGQTILFDIDESGVVYTGRTDKKDFDFVTGQNAMRGQPAKDNARAEILDYLKENGKVIIKDLNDYLKAIGISPSTARRAKEELKEEGLIKFTRESNGQSKGTTHYIEFIPTVK